jgi:hypothetical protein
MNYRNSEMKVDQFVSYLNEEKINLSPAFQRGHVWSLAARKKLLKNIILGKPIPSVFLYKEASGSKYSYNILDGKQRLESLILFIGCKREDFGIIRWDKYLFGEGPKKHIDYKVELTDGKKSFADLDEAAVRDFREYAIPTIEISLGDDTGLDEVISLFVDINQQGVAVNRFDIVKAINRNDALLKNVFDLLSVQQRRGQDVLYRMKANEFTSVIKKLKIVESAAAPNVKVDRMWERLLEFMLFYRSKVHRKPVDILKSFISGGRSGSTKLKTEEIRTVRAVFRFLRDAYKTTSLGKSRLAADQTYFYTMLTTILNNSLNATLGETALRAKLASIGDVLDDRVTAKATLKDTFKAFIAESKRQTTDVSKRLERERLFLLLVQGS